jgi:hypothetical protein
VDVDWFRMIQVRDQWRVTVNTVICQYIVALFFVSLNLFLCGDYKRTNGALYSSLYHSQAWLFLFKSAFP